jgi:transaldolase
MGRKYCGQNSDDNEGLKAVTVLSKEKLKTNVTLFYGISRLWLTSCATLSVHLLTSGRHPHSAYQLISELREFNDFYGFDTESLQPAL